VIEETGIITDGTHGRDKIVASVGDQASGQLKHADAVRTMGLLQEHIID
jgi:hypothetical protein